MQKGSSIVIDELPFLTSIPLFYTLNIQRKSTYDFAFAAGYLLDFVKKLKHQNKIWNSTKY